ncbi:MAG: hypothetical protein CVU51_03645 [Deltaproteobacteria bacterium HGW-Deltaproteobacteria-1]|nr:MAG: hypothetical protein CVU51_03645 [Deltaproteobacteria bacterium HGW-Deltaproteobacteria-1]
MIRNYAWIVIVAICLAGCSPTRDFWVVKDSYKYKFKSACVVVDEDASPEFAETITNNLTQRGVKIYPASSRTDCQADFVVFYYDGYGFEIIPPVVFLNTLWITIL